MAPALAGCSWYPHSLTLVTPKHKRCPPFLLSLVEGQFMWQELGRCGPTWPVLDKARGQWQPQTLGEETESPRLHSSPWERQ